MAEKNNEIPVITDVPESPSRFKTFVTNHPRATKVLGITAAATVVVGVIGVVRSRAADKSNAETASELDSPDASTTEA